MSGLTLEQRKKLSDLISQYGISLTQQADEKAIRKSIEETVKTIFELTRNHFRDFATAEWKDKIAETKKTSKRSWIYSRCTVMTNHKR